MAAIDRLKNLVPSWFSQREEASVVSVAETPVPEQQTLVLEQQAEVIAPKASFNNGYGSYRVLGSVGYNGEKNYGEIGPIKNYWIDYTALRYRSWQLFLESEIAQTVLGKYNTWVIGKGLKLQSEPIKLILESEKIKVNMQEFSSTVESRFAAYAKSKRSDYSNMQNLNTIQAEAYKNSMIGGDVLVVARYIDNCVKIQLIDGDRVQSPMYGTESSPMMTKNNSKIINGIEVSKTGEHIAFHVRKPGMLFETERIEARGRKTGLVMAWMVYGMKYRIDSVRGMPLLSVIFETAKKLERYKEATVGSAEERQKLAYSIEHEYFSTGENPLLENTLKAWDLARANGAIPTDDLGQAVADKFVATTNKQIYNLPLGAHLKSLESKNELYFKDFYDMNIRLICSSIQMPPEVAMSAYNSNYSASRAALKDWENTLAIQRAIFSYQFMQPIYDLFLYTEILKGKINAPGYVEALMNGNYDVTEAYATGRFVGPPVPHIDPKKEVEAERLKLGTLSAHIPLTTIEAATEALAGGDASANVEQYAMEVRDAESKGLKPVEPKAEKKKPAGK